MHTTGLDVSDKKTHICTLDDSGEVIERRTIPTTVLAIQQAFGGREKARVILEVGPHSRWMHVCLEAVGHEVIVGNPAKIPSITTSNHKSDERDAEQLARLGRVDIRLLYPVEHRSDSAQADLMHVRSRDLLVGQRTALINHIRGVFKAAGAALPTGTTPTKVPQVAAENMPPELGPALNPLIENLLELKVRILTYDKAISAMVKSMYPEAKRLATMNGVGDLTAAAFVLTIENPHRFKNPRDVGPFLGMVPKRSQSGNHDPKLGITKAGDAMLRKLLVNCAQYILGPFGEDSALRQWGLELAQRRGSKKKAAVAVARKLAVIMIAMWQKEQDYKPFPNR